MAPQRRNPPLHPAALKSARRGAGPAALPCRTVASPVSVRRRNYARDHLATDRLMRHVSPTHAAGAGDREDHRGGQGVERDGEDARLAEQAWIACPEGLRNEHL